MKITGNATVHAPIEKVWDALLDPTVLARTIPGCAALEATGPDLYRATVHARLGRLAGSGMVDIRVTERTPYRSYALRVSGIGGSGGVDATVALRLSDLADTGAGGRTRVDYDGEVVPAGSVAGVGQRLVGSAATRTAEEFLRRVDDALAAAPPDAVGERAPESAAGAGTAPGFARGGARTATMAFGAGGVGLAGAAVGWWLARKRC